MSKAYAVEIDGQTTSVLFFCDNHALVVDMKIKHPEMENPFGAGHPFGAGQQFVRLPQLEGFFASPGCIACDPVRPLEYQAPGSKSDDLPGGTLQ